MYMLLNCLIFCCVFCFACLRSVPNIISVFCFARLRSVPNIISVFYFACLRSVPNIISVFCFLFCLPSLCIQYNFCFLLCLPSFCTQYNLCVLIVHFLIGFRLLYFSSQKVIKTHQPQVVSDVSCLPCLLESCWSDQQFYRLLLSLNHMLAMSVILRCSSNVSKQCVCYCLFKYRNKINDV